MAILMKLSGDKSPGLSNYSDSPEIIEVKQTDRPTDKLFDTINVGRWIFLS